MLHKKGFATAPKPTVLSLSKLIGNPVENSRGETLGNIQEIAICPDSGRVIGVLLCPENPAAFGGAPPAIPWTALTVSQTGDMICVGGENGGLGGEDKPESSDDGQPPGVFIYTHSVKRF